MNADPAPARVWNPIEIEENYYPASAIEAVPTAQLVEGVVTQHIPIKKTVMQQMPHKVMTPRRVMVPYTTMELSEVDEDVEIMREVIVPARRNVTVNETFVGSQVVDHQEEVLVPFTEEMTVQVDRSQPETIWVERMVPTNVTIAIPDPPCHFHDAAYVEQADDYIGDISKLRDVLMHPPSENP